MQLAVVELFRSSSSPSSAFGEEEIFEKLKDWMLLKGYPVSDISEQVSRLTASPSSIRPPSPTELADESEKEEDSPGEATPTPIPESSCKLVFVDAAETDIPLGTYLVSVQVRSRFRRLHKYGECWRKPGVDYLEFEILGPELPPPTAYNAICHHCFHNGEIEDNEASSGSSSSEGSR